MSKTYLITIAAALVAAPMALAHEPGGAPKSYCEDTSEWSVHDYGAPAAGVLLQGYEDGNLAGNCNGTTFVDPGTPCAGFEDPADPMTFYVGLCGFSLDPPFADYDGHAEYSRGGAWILSCTSGCGYSGAGGGTEGCWGGNEAHHSYYGPVTVIDNVLGAHANFMVAADLASPFPDPCGDFESSHSIDCVGTCTVPFPPGLDGSYQVFVRGTAGHVIW